MKFFTAMRSIFSVLFLATLFLGLQGCGSSDDGDSTITHNGTTYGTVTSPYTGKVWLDRNLGASQICTALDDVACYGDYYQWGRNFDGHEKSDSNTTTEQAVQIDPVQQSIVDMFVTGTFEWTASGVDDDGSLRSANWSKIDGTSVCPVGFRVATIDELVAETIDQGNNNNGTTFAGFLKLPSAGYFNVSGALSNQGSACVVWSSSASGAPNSGDLFFDSVKALLDSSGRAHGYPVRCIKD